jgi:hypothetical protein
VSQRREHVRKFEKQSMAKSDQSGMTNGRDLKGQKCNFASDRKNLVNLHKRNSLSF